MKTEDMNELYEKSRAPADTRERAYLLLARQAPLRVLLDPGMKPHTWVIVAAPEFFETEEVERRKPARGA